MVKKGSGLKMVNKYSEPFQLGGSCEQG